jgi:predicted RNA-binding protein Jag
MEIEGEVVATGSDERVHIRVDAKERAGRLIGRRGATLASIRQILALALEKHGELTIDVDVEDNRSDKGDRDNRDRKESGGRGRDRDRDNRSKDRGPRYSDDKLQALAARAAEKAIETQRSVTINLELNSYGRRVVHLAIAEIEGVSSASEERDGLKVVQVVPD